MKLNDLLDVDLLGQMVSDGWVRTQRHPQHTDLAIANYTDRCAYERVWNEVTTQCRGLIWDASTLEVLARPFPKFFNHGEPGAPELAAHTPVEVTDKLDGSLGVLFPVDGGWAIATRGSFDSEQARHATALLWGRYHGRFFPALGWTYLFEIVFPGNRIVVDYGPTDDLFLLGTVNIETGQSCGPDLVREWPGPRAATFGFATFAEALAAPPRKNAEGIVVRQAGTEHRIKIKQDDYVQLHRIITGCTKRRLWEQLVVWAHDDMPDEFLTRRFFLAPRRVEQIRATGGDWLESYLANTPEEFRAWVVEQVAGMRKQVAQRWLDIRADFGILCGQAGLEPSDDPSREDSKLFAERARAHAGEDRALFNLLMTMWRAQEITSSLWREVYPEHELPYRVTDEEA